MRWQHGFTYLGLLILVAIIGMVGAAGLKVGSLLQRAQAEEELLEIGAEFSRALKSYADSTPRGHPTFPATLNELLRDPRVPGVRRHLRKIHVDPLTGKAEWGLVTMGENAGVLGVYSLSNAKPLKVANFDSRFTGFENKEKISDWKFMLPGQALLPNGAPQPGGPQSGASPRGSLPSLFGPPRGPAAAQPGQPPVPQPSPPPPPPPPPAAEPEPPQEVAPPAPVPEPEPERGEEAKDREAAEGENRQDAQDTQPTQDTQQTQDSGGVQGNRAR